MKLRTPDLQGAIARAWRFKGESDVPDHQACLSQYVVNGPFHPFWSWWMIGLISLCDIPGVPPAHKQYPDAEYELLILALNPECCPPDPDAVGALTFLTPPDLVYHFDIRNEEAAKEIIEGAVKAIIEGRISPDQDYRQIWKRILKTTVDHYKAGLH